MSKNYTFSDCVDYAYRHNIAFNFYYTSDLHYLYCDISDGYDGYLTATSAIFEYNNFDRLYHATMDLNVRYALKKDYEFMRRMEIAINTHRRETLSNVRANWNNGYITWYGNGCFNSKHINAHYVRAAFVHGDNVWNH